MERTATVVAMIATIPVAFVWSTIVAARAKNVEEVGGAVAATASTVTASQPEFVVLKVTSATRIRTAATMLASSKMETKAVTALTWGTAGPSASPVRAVKRVLETVAVIRAVTLVRASMSVGT